MSDSQFFEKIHSTVASIISYTYIVWNALGLVYNAIWLSMHQYLCICAIILSSINIIVTSCFLYYFNKHPYEMLRDDESDQIFGYLRLSCIKQNDKKYLRFALSVYFFLVTIILVSFFCYKTANSTLFSYMVFTIFPSLSVCIVLFFEHIIPIQNIIIRRYIFGIPPILYIFSGLLGFFIALPNIDSAEMNSVYHVYVYLQLIYGIFDLLIWIFTKKEYMYYNQDFLTVYNKDVENRILIKTAIESTQ
ncbi:hypothetical protein WA158_006264 [Blastocystis sp. Blastoise]